VREKTVAEYPLYAERPMSSRLRFENRIVRNLPLLSSAFMIAMWVGLVLSSGVSHSVWQKFISRTNWFRSSVWSC